MLITSKQLYSFNSLLMTNFLKFDIHLAVKKMEGQRQRIYIFLHSEWNGRAWFYIYHQHSDNYERNIAAAFFRRKWQSVRHLFLLSGKNVCEYWWVQRIATSSSAGECTHALMEGRWALFQLGWRCNSLVFTRMRSE